MKEGEGWPWVAASSVEGLKMLTLQDMKPGKYTVQLETPTKSTSTSFEVFAADP